MVDVRSRRCTVDLCTKRPRFNVEGSKTAVYCKQHAQGGMVNVHVKHCLRDSCSRGASYNIEGSTTAAYCKQHAVEGMVAVRCQCCSHDGCTRLPSWGVPTQGAPTVCAHHKSDIVGDRVINFRARCKVPGCSRVSRWGLLGVQPTHCPEHGILANGLVCTVGTAPNNLG